MGSWGIRNLIEGPRADLAERANVSQGLGHTNVSHGPIRWLTQTDWSSRCARAGSNRVRRSVRAYRMGSEVSKRDRGTSARTSRSVRTCRMGSSVRACRMGSSGAWGVRTYRMGLGEHMSVSHGLERTSVSHGLWSVRTYRRDWWRQPVWAADAGPGRCSSARECSRGGDVCGQVLTGGPEGRCGIPPQRSAPRRRGCRASRRGARRAGRP